jgi:hypothetical protein
VTSVDVGGPFSDAELILVGRFLLAVLTLEQSLKWRIACYKHNDRAKAEMCAQALDGPLGKLIGCFKKNRTADKAWWEKIDEEIDRVRQARNAVTHGLVVLMRDLDDDPSIAGPQADPLLFVFENNGERFTCEDLANLTPTAGELPRRLSALSLKL